VLDFLLQIAWRDWVGGAGVLTRDRAGTGSWWGDCGHRVGLAPWMLSEESWVEHRSHSVP
jgi:hypothetical protein